MHTITTYMQCRLIEGIETMFHMRFIRAQAPCLLIWRSARGSDTNDQCVPHHLECNNQWNHSDHCSHNIGRIWVCGIPRNGHATSPKQHYIFRLHYQHRQSYLSIKSRHFWHHDPGSDSADNLCHHDGATHWLVALPCSTNIPMNNQ